MFSSRTNFQGSTISRSPIPREWVFECPYEIQIGLHFMQKSTLPRPISNGHSVKRTFTQSSRASLELTMARGEEFTENHQSLQKG